MEHEISAKVKKIPHMQKNIHYFRIHDAEDCISFSSFTLSFPAHKERTASTETRQHTSLHIV